MQAFTDLPWIFNLAFCGCAFQPCLECRGDRSASHLRCRLKETHRAPSHALSLIAFSSTLSLATHWSLADLPSAHFGLVRRVVIVWCQWGDLHSTSKSQQLDRSGHFPTPTAVSSSQTKLSTAAGRWVSGSFHVRYAFDSTLGFPGEGPQLMTVVSANVGSLNTNQSWKSWGADITCLQETRVGKTNHKTTQKNIEAFGLRPVFGDLLPGLWHQNGTTKTPCGGTAILGSSVAIEPFCDHHDQRGLYKDLFKSKRVVAAWYQITAALKGLFFCVYATTGASSDSSIHAANDQLFDNIFLVAAQFGEIPIVVAGDFQANPMSYPSISGACQIHGWADPILETDEEGFSVRPYTYSKDCSFSGADEGCTSIDGILVNKIAFCAITEAKVLEHHGRQHRPIQITFDWPVLEQKGYVHYKFAPIDVTHVPSPRENQAIFDAWQDRFAQAYLNASDVDDKWQIINQYFQSTLFELGADWGSGPRERAKSPRFRSKKICPSQLQTRRAATKVSLDLFRLLRRLNELSCRLSRAQGSEQDQFNTRQLSIKAHRALSKFRTPVCWAFPERPTLVDLFWARTWAENYAVTLDGRIRLSRIK